MDEIANQFKEEYTELLSRYKEHLTNAQIMSILQSLTRKQIGFKDNPERFHDLDYAPGFPTVDELKTIKEIDAELKACKKDSAMYRMLKAKKFTMLYGGKWHNEEEAKTRRLCSPQEIAEADCDGDVYKCKNACGKLRMNTTNISDYQGADKCLDD